MEMDGGSCCTRTATSAAANQSTRAVEVHGPRVNDRHASSKLPSVGSAWVSLALDGFTCWSEGHPTCWTQPAGASICFQPSSPVVAESSTEYLTPSGPVSSPLWGL